MKIGENMNENYDNNRDFFISVVDAYIVECLMEFFGMENQNSQATKHTPKEFTNDEEKKEWFYSSIMEMLNIYIFPSKQYPTNDDANVIGI